MNTQTITPTIAFFNNKGEVGNTSLVYHLAWMFRELGLRVLAADLDPQANLTSAFVEMDRLEQIWLDSDQPNTVFRCLQSLFRGVGDIVDPVLEKIEDDLFLLLGDLQLSNLEEELSVAWSSCLEPKERAFRVTSAFGRLLQRASFLSKVDVVLMDLGPNLGAINRSAMIAADYVIVPLSPDLFSLQGLNNMGPTLARWREEWRERKTKNPVPELPIPQGHTQPKGYVVLQHPVRLDRPVLAFRKWMEHIPQTYHSLVLQEKDYQSVDILQDPFCLALLKNYQSLVFMAQEARKPMFSLKPADGVMGSHVNAVMRVYEDYKQLAKKMATLLCLPIEQQ